jgi:hypothetical protein
MVEQEMSALNQARPRRGRILVHLKLPDEPSPEDVANLSDDLDSAHLAYLERKWGRPLFNDEAKFEPENAAFFEKKLHRLPFPYEAHLQGFWIMLHGGKPPGCVNSPKEALIEFRNVLRRAWQGDHSDPRALDIVEFLA